MKKLTLRIYFAIDSQNFNFMAKHMYNQTSVEHIIPHALYLHFVNLHRDNVDDTCLALVLVLVHIGRQHGIMLVSHKQWTTFTYLPTQVVWSIGVVNAKRDISCDPDPCHQFEAKQSQLLLPCLIVWSNLKFARILSRSEKNMNLPYPLLMGQSTCAHAGPYIEGGTSLQS